MPTEITIRFRFESDLAPERRRSLIQQFVAGSAEMIAEADAFSIGGNDVIHAAESPTPSKAKRRAQGELPEGWQDYKTVRAIMDDAVPETFSRADAERWMLGAGLALSSVNAAMSLLIRGGCVVKEGDGYRVVKRLDGSAYQAPPAASKAAEELPAESTAAMAANELRLDGAAGQ